MCMYDVLHIQHIGDCVPTQHRHYARSIELTVEPVALLYRTVYYGLETTSLSRLLCIGQWYYQISNKQFYVKHPSVSPMFDVSQN